MEATTPAKTPHLGADHVAEAAAVAADRNEQDEEILHGAGEHHAGENPERAGKIAHLGGEHRAHQRSGPGDGGEMVTEEHVFVGGHVIQAVIARVGGGLPGGVELEDGTGEEQAIEAIGDGVDTDCRNDQPEGIDLLATGGGQHAQA